MAKPTLSNVVRNALSGLCFGAFFAALTSLAVVYGRWIKAAPTAPDPTHGLIFAHNEHGSIVFLSAAQSVGTNLPFLMIPVFFAAIIIMPKKNMKTGFLSARWDGDDPWHIYIIFAMLAAAMVFIASWCSGMDILAWIGQFGIGVTNDS